MKSTKKVCPADKIKENSAVLLSGGISFFKQKKETDDRLNPIVCHLSPYILCLDGLFFCLLCLCLLMLLWHLELIAAQDELVCQIALAHHRVSRKLLRCALEEDASFK